MAGDPLILALAVRFLYGARSEGAPDLKKLGRVLVGLSPRLRHARLFAVNPIASRRDHHDV